MTHYNIIYRHDKRIVIDDNGLDYLLHLEYKINKILTYIKDVDDATWDNTGPDDILAIIEGDDSETETH